MKSSHYQTAELNPSSTPSDRRSYLAAFDRGRQPSSKHWRGDPAAQTSHTIEDHAQSGDGRDGLVSVWTLSAPHDAERVVLFPCMTMPYFRFHAECVIKAKSEDEAKETFANDSWNFAAEADCEELPDSLAAVAHSVSDTLVERRPQRDQVLYTLVAEDAHSVAEKELGRELTEEELHIVEHEIGEYIDWDEAMTFCIRQKIAGEL